MRELCGTVGAFAFATLLAEGVLRVGQRQANRLFT
jgi:hypothetical protein